MKKKSRELNVFNMSALDLFACALGAFILLAVVALPFFPNTYQVSDAELRERVAEMGAIRDELERTRAELSEEAEARRQAEASLEENERAAQANFLLVVVSWGSSDDVDLHITDPEGREFFYREEEYPGSPARFEEDSTRGPGNEIWLHPDVTPGEYRIEYKMYAKRASEPVEVRGAALHRDGRTALSPQILSATGDREEIAVVVVGVDGSISLR